MAIGKFAYSLWGHNDWAETSAKDPPATSNVRAMAATDSGWCARFTATDTRNIKSVWVNFLTVSSPGTILLTIETIDTGTGKPTNSLYDANATKSFTPVAGWQNVIFDVTPTAGLTAGNEYGIVLVQTGSGTTADLMSSVQRSMESAMPTTVLTTTTASTRSTFTEGNGGTTPAIPILTVVLDDNSEESFYFSPFASTSDRQVFGNTAIGVKFEVVGTMIIRAVRFGFVVRSGVPPSDFQVRIFNSNDTQVTGANKIIDKESLTGIGSSTRKIFAPFSSPVTVTSGVYRAVANLAGFDGSSTNCFRIRAAEARTGSTVLPSGFAYTSTTNVTLGTISWTDTPSDHANVDIMIEDLTVAGGGKAGSYNIYYPSRVPLF